MERAVSRLVFSLTIRQLTDMIASDEVTFMVSNQKIVSALGGKTSLGQKINGPLDMDKLIREGFPYKAGSHVRALLNLSLPKFLNLIDASVSTLNRVRKANKRLPAIASDRIFRLAKIFSIACEVLEYKKKAREWLGQHQMGLGGKTPFELLRTESGTNEVQNLLWRIEYGVIS
jgi:putative toxin-antitoxin system antitoxin component (TIGR02293 family)